MSQDNSGKTPAQDELHDHAQDRSAAVQAPDDQTLQATNVPDAASGQAASAELLHAALALPPDAIAHVELTLDQLGNTVDLFDVPPFDYGDAV
jgi:hypothetical protein